jgi:hypothetical protein
MNPPKVILISDDPFHPGQLKMVDSLQRHGWPFHVISAPFRGLGYKITELAKYLKTTDDEFFIMQDAFDTYCVRDAKAWWMPWYWYHDTPLVISGEKHCYPHPDKAVYFGRYSEWRYPNSGQIYGRPDYFLKLVADNPFPEADNDQVWYTDMAIAGKVVIDTNCDMFQSIAFEVDGDFDMSDGSFQNCHTGSRPFFIHGNGRTPLDKFYAAL